MKSVKTHWARRAAGLTATGAVIAGGAIGLDALTRVLPGGAVVQTLTKIGGNVAIAIGAVKVGNLIAGGRHAVASVEHNGVVYELDPPPPTPVQTQPVQQQQQQPEPGAGANGAGANGAGANGAGGETAPADPPPTA